MTCEHATSAKKLIWKGKEFIEDVVPLPNTRNWKGRRITNMKWIYRCNICGDTTNHSEHIETELLWVR